MLRPYIVCHCEEYCRLRQTDEAISETVCKNPDCFVHRLRLCLAMTSVAYANPGGK